MFGGGNPVSGANPAGISQGLNHIGDHAYAQSGSIENAGTGGPDTTLLKFNSGSSYIVGKMDFATTNTAGHDTYLDLLYDGQKVMELKESNSAIVPMRFDIFIPPQTNVEVKMGFNSTYKGSVMISARVYR